jgi:hypothetical protein
MAEKKELIASPIDGNATLKPSKIYFFKSSSGDFSDELHVLDLSASVSMAQWAGSINEAFCNHVDNLAKEKKNDSSIKVFELNRGTFSSTMQFHDAAAGGDVVAELYMPVLKHFGGWQLKFPENSPHSSHNIEIRPVSMMRSEETFVKDSVSYSWDAASGKRGSLFKTIDGKKKLIAEFSAKTWFKNSCVLVMDSEQLDAVVTLATCVAVLNR